MKVFRKPIIPTNGSQDSYKTICAFLENYCEKNNFKIFFLSNSLNTL